MQSPLLAVYILQPLLLATLIVGVCVVVELLLLLLLMLMVLLLQLMNFAPASCRLIIIALLPLPENCSCLKNREKAMQKSKRNELFQLL